MENTLVGTCHCGTVRWTFQGTPQNATACNCTACRKYGALWIYGWDGETVSVTGETSSYQREDSHYLEFVFCPGCGACAAWRAREADKDGRTRIAVNLRLSNDPDSVMNLPVRHFDGLDAFQVIEDQGGTLRDLWF